MGVTNLNRYLMRALLAGGALLVSVPATAGEQVLYRPAPDWVVPAKLDTLLGGTEEVVLLDRQRLLDHGVASVYEDVAVRLKTPDAVAKLNTLAMKWFPDKGDLTVHDLQIIRDGKTIDLLAGGQRFTVLRRETGLERQEVNGALTATISIPDLRVGDVLRFTKTTTLQDQAFKNEVQLADGLPAVDTPIGLGRVLVSWPADQTMQWKVTGSAKIDGPAKVGGFQRLSISLPLAKQPEMPDDAPFRYRTPPLLQVSSFKSWREVSASLAPYFHTQGTIAADSPLHAEVARIEAKTTVPLERAALALQLVQDQISYLAKGMDGGNYVPQKPAETWSIRYGDCKAKSYLLAALLNEMGIKAGVVVVASKNGDMVGSLLPEAGDFDHMIVRANIDGQDYWLDGTSGGTRLSTIGEVPNFQYALPIVDGGSDLVKIAQHWQPSPDRTLRLTYDFTAGVDMPTIYDADVELVGLLAAQVREEAAEKDPKKQREYVEKYMGDLFKDSAISEGSITYDEVSGKATIHATGVYSAPWDTEHGIAKLSPVLASTGQEFAPDRARAAWKDLPVQLGGPERYREEDTFLLPDGGKGFKLSGLTDFSGVVAGKKIERKMTLNGDRVVATDDISTIPTEIAPAQIAQERANAARLKAGDPSIEASATTPFYWQLDDATYQKRTQRLEAIYSKIIANTPDEAWAWSARGWVRSNGPDKKGALADYAKAIELGPNSDRYQDRSILLADMGNEPGALADAREAYNLKPDADSGMFLARALARSKKFDDALAVLDELKVEGDDRIRVLAARADVMGEAGQQDKAWGMLADALADRPGDDGLLSEQCWFAATWKYKLDQASDICTKAVQATQWAAETLDSRALVYYRLGKKQDALADLNAALRNEPTIVGSRYLRGIIESETDAIAGRKDVNDAIRLSPSVVNRYKRYGITANESSKS